MTINYIFNEDNLLNELKEYIDRTYSEHYASNNKIQVTEFIDAHCDSPDFFRGCAMKYLARYGHKEGYNRKDLLKAVHYLVMMIDWHDRRETKELREAKAWAGPPLEKWDRLAPKHYGDEK